MPDYLGDDQRKTKKTAEKEDDKPFLALDENDIAVNELSGVKESDTGLAPPALWDIAADKQAMQQEQPLQVARCTKIITAEGQDPRDALRSPPRAFFLLDRRGFDSSRLTYLTLIVQGTSEVVTGEQQQQTERKQRRNPERLSEYDEGCCSLTLWSSLRPCLVQWLDTRPNRQVCPVCKALISRYKVIPQYGRGGNETDPRDNVPHRPRVQRQEAPQGFPGFHLGDGTGQGGMHFSLGIGVFPFSIFANIFNSSMDRRPDAPNNTH
ncbi:hypothetical protein PRIPAC_87396 [Pristionchus pacificus]|uniref:RING-type E3 ubiquitin transferase n=1 Tax=Pristionchus pacificus TaxID=54126 RepID=A0A2A6CV36_PRIPA|nr:hypothetical protein PRIPAC_87396 [Pristionchus pacificus]|eukprot:PDM82029.1 hypothetical protein PRIPAC_36422 [Pristionchus pacificus]